MDMESDMRDGDMDMLNSGNASNQYPSLPEAGFTQRMARVQRAEEGSSGEFQDGSERRKK